MKKKALAVVVFGLMLTLTLFASGREESATVGTAQPITLTLWDQFTEGTAFQKLVDTFQAANPNITIERNPMAGSDMRKVMKTTLAAGSGPDIMYYEVSGRLAELVTAGLVHDLSAMYKRYGWDKKVPGSAQTSVRLNGKLWALPNELELALMIYYHKADFQKQGVSIPGTYEEFLDLCDKFKAPERVPIAAGNSKGSYGPRLFNVFSYYIAPKEVENVIYGNGTWTAAPFVKAAGMIKELADRGAITNASTNALGGGDARAVFVSGQSTMIMSGSWDNRRFVREDPNADDLDFFLIPPHKGSGVSEAQSLVGVGSGFAVNSTVQGDRLAATEKFLDFLTSDEAVKIWIEEVQIVPGARPDMSKMDASPLVRKASEAASMDSIVRSFLFPSEMVRGSRADSQGLWSGALTAEGFVELYEKRWTTMKKEGRLILVGK